MIEIPFDHFAPLGKKREQRTVTFKIYPPACVFTPDKISRYITVIQKSWLKHFLMQPRTVESEPLRKLDIVRERFIGRRRVDAVGVISLIEHCALENAFPVE